MWETEDITVIDSRNHIPESIIRVKAVAVSDGLHKGEYAAAAMMVEGPRESQKRIVGNSIITWPPRGPGLIYRGVKRTEHDSNNIGNVLQVS